MPGKRSTRMKILRSIDGILTRLNGCQDDLLAIAKLYEDSTAPELGAALVAAENGLEIVIDLITQIRQGL